MPGPDGDRSDAVAHLRDQWKSGAIKLFIIRELLAQRNRHPDLFEGHDYRPLEVNGALADHVCAFTRHHGTTTLIVIVARHFAALTRTDATLPDPPAWNGIAVALPPDSPAVFRDVLTGRPVAVVDGGLPLDSVFATLPVAVLVATH
jgi:(1->4)-alpha-D-glucan 1-alpha-D-glucosylmutase